MFIQTEDTPNPATVKFLPGQTILENGTMNFPTLAEAQKSPLAQRLFKIQSVHGVMLGKDFVSVTKADDTDWRMLKPMVLAALMEHLSTNQPILDESAMQESANTPASSENNDDPIVTTIKELIAERVRPAVMMDGGDIVFDRFDAQSGVVYLELQGACAGCPSSTMTLKSGIENMLKHYVPEVQDVRAV